MKAHLSVATVATFALMSLAACGDSEPTDYISIGAQPINQFGGEVSVRIEQPGRVRTISHADLVKAADEGRYSISLPTTTRGTMNVQFTVVNATNDTIGIAKVDFDLVKGHAYGATLQRRPANALDFCFGCTGQTKFPIRDPKKPTTDSLWISYSAGKPCGSCVY